MEPLFHVGDRVVVDEYIQDGHKCFFEREEGRSRLSRTATVNRRKYIGFVAEILNVCKTSDGHIFYSLDIDNQVFAWPASMLLPAQEVEYDADLGVLF